MKMAAVSLAAILAAASCGQKKYYHGTLPNHQLQTVAAACGYDLTRHHHALADAEACAAIAVKLL